MKIAAIALATLSIVATAGGASAAASHFSDTDYIKASRCKGLADGLGSPDAAGLSAFLKNEGRFRIDAVLQRGADAADNAKREAKHSTEGRDRLNGELSNACAAYMGGGGPNATR